jgi:hypothetical protein
MPNKTNSYGLASLVLGIISLVFIVIFPISLLAGILAIALGLKQKRLKGSGYAGAGVTMGIIGVVLAVFMAVAIALLYYLAIYSSPKLV